MNEAAQQLLDIINEVCKYEKQEKKLLFEKELILNLNDKLSKYTDQYLKYRKEYCSNWIELLSDCMNAIENRDRVLLIDTLQYGISPFIKEVLTKMSY